MAAPHQPTGDESPARPQRQVRIVGAEREAMAAQVAERYQQGESIRGIAEELDRSYGFVQALLRETNTRTRPRGGDHQPSALDVPDPLRIDQDLPPMPKLLPDERPLAEDPIARTIRWLTGREPSAPATDPHGAADRSTDDQQAAEQEKKMKSDTKKSVKKPSTKNTSGKKKSDLAKAKKSTKDLGKKAKAEMAKLEKAATKKAKKAAAKQDETTKKAKKQAKADKQAAKDRAKKAGLKSKKAADKQKKAKPATKKAQVKKAAKKSAGKKA